MDLAAHYREDIIVQFQKLKALADGAIAQASDEELFKTLDPESNSIATVMRHIAGNLRSRFRDFLTSDGEKPDRHRDGEFEMPPGASRESVVAEWESGFAVLFGSLAALTPADLLREVYIRGERFTVVQALHRALTHVASHVGQIVWIAKYLRGSHWKTLSIPRGQSDKLNGPRRF
jgi:Protein of unknown function (DUF1572)